MKFHGSYQQDNRDLRAMGKQKAFQFMLRMKMPSGEFPASLYKVIDDISAKYGNQTIRATTRCAWQIHGILKSDLKAVFSSIMNAGGSCTGACGDLSRNVMCTPAPFTNFLYADARHVSKMVGELFAPQSSAFSEIWLDGEKAASIEYWKKDLNMDTVKEIMRFDNGNGVVFSDTEEPIYGETYLPRKFKVGVTVPGDNSIDIYTQDIGIVCIPGVMGTVEGYNLIVGGGMGRTHRKESTFARTGDHFGYVSAEKLWEALKAIVAAQRDHGNRSIRANARMKYLVDKMGIDSFRSLVETYFGSKFEPFRELEQPWKYEDWLGWHEQGDGHSFLGLFVEHGRIKDDGDMRLKTALRKITNDFKLDMVVTPNQNVLLKNIPSGQKEGIENILREHNVRPAEDYDLNRRLSMACPALPLCGLAVAEAERVMPDIVDRITQLFSSMGVNGAVTMRMTGCPNGCARPYMAEIGFVGCGVGKYQIWLGGCPNQTRLAWVYMEKGEESKLEQLFTPIIDMYKKKALELEAFGDFCNRMGKREIEAYVEGYASGKKGVKITVIEDVPKVSYERLVRVTAVAPDGGSEDVGSGVDLVDEGSSGVENSEESNGAEANVENTQGETEVKVKRTRKKSFPRLTVNKEIMDRLKNIAALRDLSASAVADEILSTYLENVDDEDVLEDDDVE